MLAGVAFRGHIRFKVIHIKLGHYRHVDRVAAQIWIDVAEQE